MADLATPESIRAADFSFHLHMKLAKGGCHFEYVHTVYPELAVVKRRERAGEKMICQLFVGEIEAPWLDLDQAARLINEARQQKVAAHG